MRTPYALIIEDDHDLASIFSLALEKAEYSVNIIYDGQDALTLLNHVIPDLILLDLHLPYKSGKSILEFIRSRAAFDQVHVILATADELSAKKLRPFVDEVIIKPFQYQELYRLVRRLNLPSKAA